MFSKFWNNPLYRFLGIAAVLFSIWVYSYETWIYNNVVDQWIIDNLTAISSNTLENWNYTLIPEYDPENFRTIGIDGTGGLWIGNECDGLYLFAIFLIFMLAIPGNWYDKLWFIPFGLIVIHLFNVLRIVALAITLLTAPDRLEFNHTYLFQTLMYGVIFALWYFWTTKISPAQLLTKSE